jgi:hypothetical protein
MSNKRPSSGWSGKWPEDRSERKQIASVRAAHKSFAATSYPEYRRGGGAQRAPFGVPHSSRPGNKRGAQCASGGHVASVFAAPSPTEPLSERTQRRYTSACCRPVTASTTRGTS